MLYYSNSALQFHVTDTCSRPTPLQIKRPKPDSAANGASGSLPAPTGDVDMIDANAINPALIPPPPADASAAEAADEKAKLAIFTTGSDSEDDVPLAARAGKNGHQDSSSEDEKPLVQKAKTKKEKEVKQQVKAEEKVEKEVAKLVEKVEDQEDSSSEDEKPLKAKAKSKNAKASSSKPKKGKKAKSEDDDEDMDDATESDNDDGEEDYESDAPKSKKKAPAKKKAVAAPKKETKPKAAPKKAKKEEGGDAKPKAAAKGKGKAKKEGSADQEDAKSGESGDEGVYRWWDQQDDGVTKVGFSSSSSSSSSPVFSDLSVAPHSPPVAEYSSPSAVRPSYPAQDHSLTLTSTLRQLYHLLSPSIHLAPYSGRPSSTTESSSLPSMRLTASG